MLADKQVVVVGGSSGIGEAVAVAAHEAGARVFAIGRSGRAPTGVDAIAVDVRDQAALAAALSQIGTIDHLVHTVGARIGSPVLRDLTEADLQLAFGTKLFSAVHTARLALPHLAERASITFTSGQVSRKFGIGSLVKGALNAAVDTAGKHLAKELAPRRVNVVSPGVVDTVLWGEAGSAARQAMADRMATALPVRRIGAPEELARAYLFLMTNEFVTGTILDIDGGGLL